MLAQKQTGTAPERAVLTALHRRGLRYRKHLKPLQTLRCKADAVFGPSKVAVFVDGCFWHGCPEHRVSPKANRDWWESKIVRTIARDRRNDAALAEAGWTVIRIWEHDDPEAAAARIEAAVKDKLEAQR